MKRTRKRTYREFTVNGGWTEAIDGDGVITYTATGTDSDAQFVWADGTTQDHDDVPVGTKMIDYGDGVRIVWP